MYEPISPTAATIAWLRSQEGVHYAKKIAELADVEDVTRAFYHDPHFDIDLSRMAKMGPWSVLRLFALQQAILSTGIQNVLEIASGLSPSGLLMSEDHPGMEYLETDLPEMSALKSSIASRIMYNLPRANLSFMAADAMDAGQLKHAADAIMREGPLAIANEGLMQYLTHEEKRVLAANIRAALEERGGAWITTDIVRKEDFNYAFNVSAYVQNVRDVMAKKTGRDMVGNAFDSFDEAKLLFEECGFTVEMHTQLDMTPDLLTPDALLRHRHLQVQQVWIMRPKD